MHVCVTVLLLMVLLLLLLLTVGLMILRTLLQEVCAVDEMFVFPPTEVVVDLVADVIALIFSGDVAVVVVVDTQKSGVCEPSDNVPSLALSSSTGSCGGILAINKLRLPTLSPRSPSIISVLLSTVF